MTPTAMVGVSLFPPSLHDSQKWRINNKKCQREAEKVVKIWSIK